MNKTLRFFAYVIDFFELYITKTPKASKSKKVKFFVKLFKSEEIKSTKEINK